MENLLNKWDEFKDHIEGHLAESKKSMSSNFWKVATLSLGILLFSTGMTMDTRDKLSEKIDTEQIDIYLTKRDFLIYQELKWAKMEQILSYERGALPDSIILDAAENWKWIVDVVFQTDASRGVFDSRGEYEIALKKIIENKDK